jgi:hemerythrin superfamily protein
MTTEQRQILSKLIDANWEANNTDNSYRERDTARQEYYRLKHQLIESMGENAYREFMNQGNKFFGVS